MKTLIVSAVFAALLSVPAQAASLYAFNSGSDDPDATSTTYQDWNDPSNSSAPWSVTGLFEIDDSDGVVDASEVTGWSIEMADSLETFTIDDVTATLVRFEATIVGQIMTITDLLARVIVIDGDKRSTRMVEFEIRPDDSYRLTADANVFDLIEREDFDGFRGRAYFDAQSRYAGLEAAAVAPVPLPPAGAVLLLGALSGLACLRRRTA